MSRKSPQSGQTENPKSDEDEELELLKEQLAKKSISATNTDKLDEKNRQEIQDAKEKIENLKTKLESEKKKLVNISSDKDETMKNYIKNRTLSQIKDQNILDIILHIISFENEIEKQNELIESKKIEIASRRKSYWQPKPRKTRNTSRQKKLRSHMPVNSRTVDNVNQRKQNQEEIKIIEQRIKDIELNKRRKELQKQRKEELQKVEKSTKKKNAAKENKSKKKKRTKYTKYSIYHQYTF